MLLASSYLINLTLSIYDLQLFWMHMCSPMANVIVIWIVESGFHALFPRAAGPVVELRHASGHQHELDYGTAFWSRHLSLPSRAESCDSL